MGKRHPNWRRIKTHRTYSINNLARELSVHENTIRNWIRDGLLTVDGKRPYLFRGAVVIDFLRARRIESKRPMRTGEIYCLGCREPKRPAGGMADLTQLTDTTGNLCGICPDCDRMIYRRVRRANLASNWGSLAITVRQAHMRILERG
jgi:hypothetical protein